MKPIEVYSNWCYIDRLDGTNVRDGEPVSVCWPDGTTTIEVLRLDKRSFIYNDMGHEYTGPDHKSFIEKQINGAAFRTYLRGRQDIFLSRVASASAGREEEG